MVWGSLLILILLLLSLLLLLFLRALRCEGIHSLVWKKALRSSKRVFSLLSHTWSWGEYYSITQVLVVVFIWR